MELTIKTEKLQEIVGRVIRCSSDNKLVPMTSLMNIKVVGNKFTLATTDATNYFFVTLDEKVDSDDFEVSVNADLFTKLVLKTTSPTITLIIDNKVLEVKGNGSYKIGVQVDPADINGGAVKFPKVLPDTEPTPDFTTKRTIIDKALQYNKPSLAVSVNSTVKDSHPSLGNYYCGDRVVTSNNHIICSSGIKLFERDMQVSPQLMELLGILSEETINVAYITEGKYTIFWTSTDTIYAPDIEQEKFPIEGVNQLINSEYASTCVVSRDAILTLLDRLVLFVDSYDNKIINLTFTNEGIMFSSKQSSGTELVPFIESENFKPFIVPIDIEYFRAQIVSQNCEKVTVSYGNDYCLKMVFDNIIQLIAIADVGGDENA